MKAGELGIVHRQELSGVLGGLFRVIQFTQDDAHIFCTEKQLEKEIVRYVGTKYSLTFNSGTSALHADLLAHNVTDGEVIVPSFSFISTANVVVLAGAKPRFAEIEEESYGLNPESVKEKIASKTKAIIPVHYGGAPCKEIKALKEIADDHNLLLIEDAAESFGAKFGDKDIGTFGGAAILSFCQNKIITAGEGGAVVTNDKNLYVRINSISNNILSFDHY